MHCGNTNQPITNAFLCVHKTRSFLSSHFLWLTTNLFGNLKGKNEQFSPNVLPFQCNNIKVPEGLSERSFYKWLLQMNDKLKISPDKQKLLLNWSLHIFRDNKSLYTLACQTCYYSNAICKHKILGLVSWTFLKKAISSSVNIAILVLL